jgi:uncharacterized membrane protein YheB (UPF0754 family)
MEFFHNIINFIEPVFKNLYVQIGLLIAFATFHGYAGAWLAVRMLFRPRKPVKLLGITVFPQGMIPRNRERLAAAIGKAVGDELMSQDTIMGELLGKDFLRKKIAGVIDSYTEEILSVNYPSLVEALPAGLRESVLDGITAIQFKLADHIETLLQSPESVASINDFVARRVDDILSMRVSDVVDDELFEKIVDFVNERIKAAVGSDSLEERIGEFIGSRIDDLVHTDTPLGAMFTADAVELLKEKANEQVEPVIHRLTELAAAERTRSQIGALIKREVHEYYEALPFFKKIFVSRENLLGEVDDLVNESLPKRIEETLKGDFFAAEARNFIDSSIDSALARPLPDMIGNIETGQLDRLKAQITRSILAVLRGEEMSASISEHVRSTLEKLRPHSIDAIMATVNPASEDQLKEMLSRSLMKVLSNKATMNLINNLLAKQIDALLARPIGKVSDMLGEESVRSTGGALADTLIAAIREKLPDAIREFDVGGVVREKINNYPAEKLEALVMSVAKEHLRTIELFGALFGFLIGLVQAIQFYIYAR